VAHRMIAFVLLSMVTSAGNFLLFWLALANEGFGYGRANAPPIIHSMGLHLPLWILGNVAMYVVPIWAMFRIGFFIGVGALVVGRLVGRPLAFGIARKHFRPGWDPGQNPGQ